MSNTQEPFNQPEETEIDLREILHLFKQNWIGLIIAALVGGLLALVYTFAFVSPQYESQSMLYILSKTTSITSLTDLQIGTQITADFEVIATSKPVFDAAIDRIEEENNQKFTRGQLNEMVTVTNQTDTRILVIKATSENPTDAAIVANAVAQETANQMAYIMKADPPTTVETAEVSTVPVSPSVPTNTAIGVLLGLLLFIAYIIIRFAFNDNICTEEDIQKYLGLNTLVIMPYEEALDTQKNKKRFFHKKKV